METALDISDLSVKYGNADALLGINLKIEKGDFVGLVGPNGSGKTTLIKAVLGLLPARQGTIKLFGTDLKDFKDWNEIGYVPQKAANIDPNFPASVEEVVQMGCLSGKKFPKKITEQDKKNVENALKLVRMESLSGKMIGELSGGQQQRVLIAKALVSEPKLLFLDEPTTGIDAKSRKEFYGILETLKKQGITIILVSHDTGRIDKHITKIASLNGRLEFYGTHKEFCSNANKHERAGYDHRLCLHRS